MRKQERAGRQLTNEWREVGIGFEGDKIAVGGLYRRPDASEMRAGSSRSDMIASASTKRGGVSPD